MTTKKWETKRWWIAFGLCVCAYISWIIEQNGIELNSGEWFGKGSRQSYLQGAISTNAKNMNTPYIWNQTATIYNVLGVHFMNSVLKTSHMRNGVFQTMWGKTVETIRCVNFLVIIYTNTYRYYVVNMENIDFHPICHATPHWHRFRIFLIELNTL